MSSHGFLGDALVSHPACHQFGFTRNLLHDVGAHFKTQISRFWDSSLCVGFLSSHHHPATFLPACMVIQTDDGQPPLAPILAVSSVLGMTPAVDGDDTSPHHSF